MFNMDCALFQNGGFKHFYAVVVVFFFFVYDCRSHKHDTTAACTGQAGYSFMALCFWCELLIAVVIPINYKSRSKQYKKFDKRTLTKNALPLQCSSFKTVLHCFVVCYDVIVT